MSTATTTTKQSDLERIERIKDLILNFGWQIERPLPSIDEDEKAKLDQFLDLIDSQASSQDPVPEEFWKVVCPHWTPTFKSLNDARLMAMALCPHADALSEWIYEQTDPSSDESIQWILDDLQPEYSSFAGVMFTESSPAGTSIWFGRKANQTPFFTGADTIDAARFLFGVKRVARPVSGREEPATKAEPARGKAKSPKLVKRKELPAVAKGADKGSSRRSEMATIAVPKQSLEFIDIDCIESDPENDRKTFDKAELQELADSIKRHGVLQPINLRVARSETGHNTYGLNRYIIVAGERRWRAAKIAGLKEVPAQISDREGLSVSLARLDENLKRVDLSPIEKAQALKRLMDAHGLTQKEVGEAVGVQQGQVSNMLRLLDLPELLQKRVANQEVAPTLVRPLLPFADVPAVVAQVDARIEEALKDQQDIPVRDFEYWVNDAVRKHSRTMRPCSNHWSKPTKTDRFFTATKEQEKELDVRKVDGELRAFNVKLFDQLNKEPLAKKLAAYKKKHASSGRTSDSGPTKEKPLKEYSEYRVPNEIRVSLMPALVAALQKESPESNRVLWTLAVHGCFTDLVGYCDNKAVKIFGMINADAKQTLAMLRKSAAKCLKHGRLSVVEIMTFAASMKLDLVATWKPTKELLSQFTLTGLQQVARAIDVNETLAEAKLRDTIQKEWPAGYVPPFLNSHFGIKAPAKKKAKAA